MAFSNERSQSVGSDCSKSLIVLRVRILFCTCLYIVCGRAFSCVVVIVVIDGDG